MSYPCVRVAHRGASGLFPENTMLAFRSAIEAGIDGLEVDVQVTCDGHLVIMHDESVNRTTNGSGFVHDHTLAQIRELDAGQGERVPTLAQVFALAEENDLRVFVEIKGIDEGASVEITNLTMEAMQRAGMVSRSILTSFFPGALLRAKTVEPCLATLLDPSPQDGTLTPVEICEQTLAAHANIISFDFKHVTPAVARQARLTGLALYPWAPNTPDEQRRMLDLYVSGIMTDRPDVLNETIARWSKGA